MLAERLGVPHISSGDLFRYHQKEGTPLGLKTKEYMSQGLLVPDEITIAMVLEQIQPPRCLNGFLLDGFPRTLAQAWVLDVAPAGTGFGIDRAILIEVPIEELIRRLSGRLVCQQCQAPYHSQDAAPKTAGRCNFCGGELYQRDDDAPEAVRVRLQVYQEETEPLIDHYIQQKKLVRVDGVGTVEEVGQKFLDSLQH